MPKDSQEKIELEHKVPKKIKNAFVFVFATILILILALYVFIQTSHAPDKNSTGSCYINKDLDTKQVVSNGDTVLAEVVYSDEEKSRGLSGRDCLSEDRGMLFMYEDSSIDRCFWMRDMKFPIDIIWLNGANEIVTISDNIQPNTYPNSFCPSEPAVNVLELNAGRASSLGWEVGTNLSF